MKKHENKSEAEILRQKAEDLVETRRDVACNVSATSPQDVACNVSATSPRDVASNVSPRDVACNVSTADVENRKLIFELEVHQVELDLQNKELMLAKEHSDIAAEKYTQLFNFAPIGYLLLSREGTIVEVNLNGAKMLGKERSKLTGNQFGAFLTTESKPVFTLFSEKVFSSKVKGKCEVIIESEGNLPIYAAMEGIVAENTEQCLVNIVDITERKHAQQELQASEERYHSIFQGSPEGILIADAETKMITYANAAQCRVFGYTEQQFKTMSIAAIHPPDTFGHTLAEFESMLHGEKALAENIQCLKQNGEIFYADISGALISINGRTQLLGFFRDITARKMAEGEQKKLSQAVDQSPVIIYITNLGGIIEYANPKATEVSGYSNKELVGQNPRIFSSGEKPQAEYKTLWQAISAGKEWKGVFPNMKKNGELYTVAASISPVMNNIGEVTHYMAIEEDITIRMAAENQLRLSEEKYRNIFESVYDAYFEAAIDGTLLEISPSIEIITKGLYSRNDMIGQPFTGVYANQEERNIYFSKLVEQKRVTDFELSLLNKDGSIIPVAVSSLLSYDADGKPAKITGILRDITERKNAEQEIRNLNTNLELKVEERTAQLAISNAKLEQENAERLKVSIALQESLDRLNRITDRVPGVVFKYQLNPDGSSCFPYASEGIYDIYRVTQDEIIDDASIVFTRIHPDDLDNAVASIQASAKEMKLWHHEYRLKYEDGTVRWVLGNAMPQAREDGSVLWHGYISDITDSKLAEKALIAARTEADRANFAKSEFLSRMSHELRTPMNSILGFAQLMEMSELKASHKKWVNSIQNSGKHLLSLINQVLELAEIESGKQILKPEPVGLSAIMNEISDVVQVIANQRNVSIEIVDSSASNLFVFADKLRMKQVLLNLTSNAIKYNREGGSVTIKTALQPADAHGNAQVRISISDTGHGIKPEDIPKLFQPFGRIGADKTKTEGTGLGLVVVQELIDAMKGAVGVESEAGVGSTFWVELPFTENRKSYQQQNEENIKTVH